MGLLKAWMTEILLDVTNAEMQTVAKEVIQYEKGIYQINLLLLFLGNFRKFFFSYFYINRFISVKGIDW